MSLQCLDRATDTSSPRPEMAEVAATGAAAAVETPG